MYGLGKDSPPPQLPRPAAIQHAEDEPVKKFGHVARIDAAPQLDRVRLAAHGRRVIIELGGPHGFYSRI